MNIFYAFNDAYAALAGISIYSLLVNNAECEDINIYIVDSGISENNKEKIRATADQFNCKLRFYNMPDFSSILGENIDTGRWNINVYSKLFVGSILPKDVHKIISVDCDTVIVNSINDLWNTDLSNYVVAGVNEAMSDGYRTNLEKNSDDLYINSGLVVLNVDALRENQYETRFVECMERYGSSLAYLDQDVINAVIPQEKMYELHPKYNAITPVFACTYKELLLARKAHKYYSETEFFEAQTNPSIIHFTTFFMNDLRPWYEGSKHPKLDEFLKYKKQSLWRDEPNWIDRRKGLKKFKAQLVQALPRLLQCWMSSMLHGIVVPRNNYKKMRNSIKGNT